MKAEMLRRFFNAEDAEGFAEDAELLTQEKIERVLHDLLKGLQELGPDCTVDYPMIAGHRDAHSLADDNLTIVHHGFGGRRAYCQNRSFRWIDHRGELVNAKHSQIADRESRAHVFFRF